ncbi:MAG: SBBP repeat-containing protein, partial [Ignavibacteriota bacterium]
GTSDGGSGGSGSPHFDYATLKYNNAGVFQWVRRYNGSANSSDEAKSLKLDISGNVVVTGSSTNSGADDDYLTIKYTPAGDTVWISKYDGTGNNSDIANCVALDDLGNTFVTGKSYGGSISDFDIVTIKYDTFGDSVWVRRYNGEANDIDEGIALAVDKTGNLFVAGYSSNVMTAFDYTTIKYTPDGTEDWTIKYTNSDFAGSSEEPTGMFVDTLSNIYITGMSALDYATVKYIQTPTSVGSTLSQIPTVFSLEQNYPNPFNPNTTISYQLPISGQVTLKVYDVLGDEVATLVNEENPAGFYKVEFDASKLSSGIYFYKIQFEKFVETKKMILLK